MRVTVLFFARARDDAGRDSAIFDLPDGATIAALRAHLASRVHPALGRYGFAVNEIWAKDDQALADGDEVAVLPPISGGSFAALTESVIDPMALVPRVADEGSGAVVLFLGTVRNAFEGRPSMAVRYEGYWTMAEKELAHIAAEAEATGEEVHVAVVHRLGTLRLGEVSVAIAAAAPHRAEAFDACRLVIERIKTSVPIWKKEIGPGGSEAWHDASAPAGQDEGVRS